MKLTKQDLLHGLTVLLLAWMIIQQAIKPLISEKSYAWLSVIILFLNGVVYYSDVLFKSGDIQPPTPPQ